MDNLSLNSDTKRRVWVDLLLVILAAAITWVMAGSLDLAERWINWAALGEHYQLDELIFVLLVSCIGLMWFGKRRFVELENVLIQNLKIQSSLEGKNHEIAQLNKKLKSRAYSDSLTGIWNRYRMEEAIDAELNAAERHDRPLTVLLFDIDHFKYFNDTHGHEAGDEVLVTLSSVLQNKLRPTDNLGRWGGEEFLVLASDCDLTGGTHLAERLKQSAEALDLGKLGGVTISIGVATWQPGESRKTLVARADQAMYRAKENGRNQVEAEAVSP